jgi:two-component system cell cycle response regulator
MSAKVLKVVNSAYYNFSNQISTIQQAVSILGINAVRSLVLSFTFFKIRKAGFSDPFDYEKFWERALSSAVAAKLLAQAAAGEGFDPDEAFTAALLQNLGVLILARTLPEEYVRVMERAPQHDTSTAEIETELLGINHIEVGFEAAKAWGFPPILFEPIRHHHQPGGYSDGNDKIRKYCHVVHLSDLLAAIFYSDTPEEYHKAFRQKVDRTLRLNDTVISRVLDQLDTEIKKAGPFFGVHLKNLRSIEEILQEANARLSLINMSYEQMNRELIAAKVKLQQLTKELEEKNRRLETLAHVDGLTEVYNHRYFQETLGREISRSGRTKKPLSLILVDVDHFKKFNDTHGHQTGDFILKETCRVMGEVLRQYDTLARYGGEEFAVVLPETRVEDADEVAEKLRRTVAEAEFEKGPERFGVTVSCGVAGMDAEDPLSSSELIERADKSLFAAKKKGRNRVVRFTLKKGWFGKAAP